MTSKPRTTAPSPRRDAELAFLPAALEIERSPPQPLARAIAWTLMLLLLATLVWTCLGRVEIVVSAAGQIAPVGQVKSIQPLESGIIQAIHVSEGQDVAAGALLVALDTSALDTDHTQLEAERLHLEREQLHFRTLLGRLRGPASGATALPARLAARTEREYASFAAERQALREEIQLQRAEGRVIEAQLAQLAAIVPLLSERAAAVGTLAERALAPRAAWLELEESRLQRTHEQRVLHARGGISTARTAAAEQRLALLRARTEAAWLEQLALLETQLATKREALRKNTIRRKRHELRAPLAGTVEKLAVATLGGVVAPGQRLMNLVPHTAPLQIEAWIANRDIGFVHPGQTAVIKVDTFPFTRYGTLAGRIVELARDASVHERHGPVYLAQIRLEQDRLMVDGKPARLAPGMAVRAEIDLGTRRIVEFLLAPLLRYRAEALRER